MAAAAARRQQEAHRGAHRGAQQLLAAPGRRHGAAGTAGTASHGANQEEGAARHAQIHPRPAPRGRDQARHVPTAPGDIDGGSRSTTSNSSNGAHPLLHHLPRSSSSTSSASAAIPIPSHHIRRTASEVQLWEDEVRAEYRDRAMYARCYPAIAGATTARTRRATLQPTTVGGRTVPHQQQRQLQLKQQQQQAEPTTTTNLLTTAAEAGRHLHPHPAAGRRYTAPPVLSYDDGGDDDDWLLYDDHPPGGPSATGAGAGADAAVAGAEAAAALEVPDRSANPRMSYVDDDVAEEGEVESPSGPSIDRDATPRKDATTTIATATGVIANEEGSKVGLGDSGWPVGCSETRRNVTILRKASEAVYSTAGTATTPSSSSNPASRTTSRTTSREEGDFDPYCQDDHAAVIDDDDDRMQLDAGAYLEGELHDCTYEHPRRGPMQPRPLPAGGGRTSSCRKNSASSYEDVFVIEDL